MDASNALQSFGQGVTNSLGGDWGNALPGYRDMRQQIATTQEEQAKTQLLQKQAQETDVDTKIKDVGLKLLQQRQQLMQRLAKEQQPTDPDAPPASQEDVALQALAKQEKFAAELQKVDPIEAGKLLAQTSEIRSRLATSKNAEARTKNLEFDQKEKLFKDGADLMASVHTPEEFAQAQMNWNATHPDAPFPFAGVAPTPANLDLIRKATKTGLENIQLQRQLDNDKAKKVMDEQKLAFEERRTKVLEAGERRRARLEKEQKTSGVIKVPPTSLVTLATARINDAFKDAPLPDEEKYNAAFDTAALAQELLQKNMGLKNASDAMDQAWAIKKNEFESVAKDYGIFGKWNKHTEYKKGGAKADGTVDAPMELPSSGSRDDLKVGKVYTDGSNKYKWDGSTFVPVTGSAKKGVEPVGPIEGDTSSSDEADREADVISNEPAEGR